MSAPAPAGPGLTLEEHALELWFVERFDTAMIRDLLCAEGHEITEAQVAHIVADEMERRHAVRTAGARP